MRLGGMSVRACYTSAMKTTLAVNNKETSQTAELSTLSKSPLCLGARGGSKSVNSTTLSDGSLPSTTGVLLDGRGSIGQDRPGLLFIAGSRELIDGAPTQRAECLL